MERKIITFTDEGAIVVPDDLNKVRMTIGEMANLLGIYYQTAKRHVRAIEQSGIAEGDYKMTCIVDSHGAHPEYYGLEMIVEIAFRVKSWQADKFRWWIIERAMRLELKPSSLPPISVYVSMREKREPN
jgi:hypothetical protein